MAQGPVSLLIGLAMLLSQEIWQEYVRVTYYVLPGFMANGERVHMGAAACSYGYPMGTLLEFPDGFVVECKDRGYLGRDRGWVDVWSPSLAWGRRYITGDYGDYTWVTVLRWGAE